MAKRQVLPVERCKMYSTIKYIFSLPMRITKGIHDGFYGFFIGMFLGALNFDTRDVMAITSTASRNKTLPVVLRFILGGLTCPACIYQLAQGKELKHEVCDDCAGK